MDDKIKNNFVLGLAKRWTSPVELLATAERVFWHQQYSRQ